MRRAIVALAAITLATSACASSSGSDGAPRGRRDRITAAELVEYTGQTAYRAIEQLRPEWLRTRRGGAAPRVVVDRAPVDVEYLRSLMAGSIEEMLLISAGVATTRYGSGYQSGAIEIRTKS